MREYFFIPLCICAASSYAQVSFSLIDDHQTENCCFVLDGVSEMDWELFEASTDSNEFWRNRFLIQTNFSEKSVLGNFEAQGRKVIFRPRFPLDQGLEYRLTYLKETKSIEIPWYSKLTEVVDVQPTGKIPANLLRLYIHFSQPMGVSNPYNYLKLSRDNVEINDAFVEVNEGLWNVERTRLTVLLHPGRIKQNVGPNLVQGSILQAGSTYHLQIEGDWKDSNGRPLGRTITKALEISGPIISRIDVSSWEISGSSESIIIRTDRQLDHGIVNQKLSITLNQNEHPGTWNVNETVLHFIPEMPLPNGEYKLFVQPTLEDVSGNTLLNSFDSRESRKIVRVEPAVLSFEIGD